MARPKKYRRVCHYPQTLSFFPAESHPEAAPVLLTVDEYETIRLIDKEGLSQEECGIRMRVARTTIQSIYSSARKKLAEAIVDGRPLEISGGDYRLCSGEDSSCGHSGCFMQAFHDRYKKPKGDMFMRIAVTYQDGEIFQHFGHTQQFKVYDVKDNQILCAQIIDTAGSGHGALAGVLNALHADILICGGIGSGAQMALASAGIQLFGGVSGNADAAVKAFLSGELAYNPHVQCNHHDHHHGENHTCGDHGCGSHSCGH